MSKEKKPTKAQHFVPRTYLRGFSPKENKVYAYDINNNKQLNDLIPIDTICRKDYLYEIHHEDHVEVTNYLEHCFQALESMFPAKRYLIEQHVQEYKLGLDPNIVISEEEIAFWQLYIVLQMFRMPHFLQQAQIVFENNFSELLNYPDQQKLVFYESFPFYTDEKETIEIENHKLFYLVSEMVNHLNLYVGIGRHNSFFTSDNPVACFGDLPKFGAKESKIREIFFPVTASLALTFDDISMASSGSIIQLTTGRERVIKERIAYTATRWIYSFDRLSKADLLIIKNAREQRKIIGG